MRNAFSPISVFDPLKAYSLVQKAIKSINSKFGSPLSKDDVNELIQATITDVLVNKDKFDGTKGTLAAWCNTFSKNAYLTAIDNKKRDAERFKRGLFTQHGVEADEYYLFNMSHNDDYAYEGDGLGGMFATSGTIEDSYCRKEQKAWLRQEIARLTPTQREVVKLILQGYSVSEVSEILNCTPNAVSVACNKAKAALRKRKTELDSAEEAALETPCASVSGLAA